MYLFIRALLLAIFATNVFAMSAMSAYTPTIYPMGKSDISAKPVFTLRIIQEANPQPGTALPQAKLSAPAHRRPAHLARPLHHHHHHKTVLACHRRQRQETWCHAMEQTRCGVGALLHEGRQL